MLGVLNSNEKPGCLIVPDDYKQEICPFYLEVILVQWFYVNEMHDSLNITTATMTSLHIVVFCMIILETHEPSIER